MCDCSRLSVARLGRARFGTAREANRTLGTRLSPREPIAALNGASLATDARRFSLPFAPFPFGYLINRRRPPMRVAPRALRSRDEYELHKSSLVHCHPANMRRMLQKSNEIRSSINSQRSLRHNLSSACVRRAEHSDEIEPDEGTNARTFRNLCSHRRAQTTLTASDAIRLPIGGTSTPSSTCQEPMLIESFVLCRRRTSSNPDSPNDAAEHSDSINHVPSQNPQTGFLQTR